MGTVAEILKVLEMPDGSTTVIIQGKRRFRVSEFLNEDPYFRARVEVIPDLPPADNAEFSAIVGSLKDLSIKIAHFSSNVPPRPPCRQEYRELHLPDQFHLFQYRHQCRRETEASRDRCTP